jgi:DNA-binding CsgD family transcriptional regulator
MNMTDDSSFQPHPLSPREKEVLALIARGCTSKKIGLLLNIDERTVASHRRSIRTKLQVKNAAGMIRHALKMKLID